MPIESFLEYIRYEKNLSTHTVLSYRNDLFQFKKFLETECDGIEMQKVTFLPLSCGAIGYSGKPCEKYSFA